MDSPAGSYTPPEAAEQAMSGSAEVGVVATSYEIQLPLGDGLGSYLIFVKPQFTAKLDLQLSLPFAPSGTIRYRRGHSLPIVSRILPRWPPVRARRLQRAVLGSCITAGPSIRIRASFSPLQ
jgi:hypothetical protein